MIVLFLLQLQVAQFKPLIGVKFKEKWLSELFHARRLKQALFRFCDHNDVGDKICCLIKQVIAYM